MTITEFAWAMFAYCTLTDASETSGTRSRKHNADEGGVAHSAHVVGLARDVRYDAPIPELDRREWAERLGLRLIVEADHDHLQPLDWKAG